MKILETFITCILAFIFTFLDVTLIFIGLRMMNIFNANLQFISGATFLLLGLYLIVHRILFALK